MKPTLKKLQTLLPNIQFKTSDSYYWSPKSRTVFYNNQQADKLGTWALLHEAGHAVLNHEHYETDFELLLFEVAAWEQARTLADQMGHAIDPEHIQDCLDTYRDWLHQRATCPRCGIISLETSTREYQCFNCQAEWQVSPSRFCRPYRRRINAALDPATQPSR